MGRPDGTPVTPEAVQVLLDREPIMLGEASIGTVFRNTAEVEDISGLSKRLQRQARKRGESLVAVGLVGSRAEGNGAFYYSAMDLLNKKLLRHGSLGLTDWIENQDTFPPSSMDRITAFAEFLRVQQEQMANISRINLTRSDFSDLATFPLHGGVFGNIPLGYKKGVQWEQVMDKVDPVFIPHPSFFYPDIDLVAISTANPLHQEDLGIGDFILLGENSGTAIQQIRLFPLARYMPGDQTEIKEDMLAHFRPLVV